MLVWMCCCAASPHTLCLCGCAAMLPPHIHYACVDVLLCCLLTYIQGCQPWPGGLPLFCSCLLLCLGITAPCLPNLFILVSRVLNPLCHHNFQHWMSWLGWWWRVQQSVISMLNSRISWINRDLNAHCAFGVFPKACLLQRLFSNINKLCHGLAMLGLCMLYVSQLICLWHMQYIACLLATCIRSRIDALLLVCGLCQAWHFNALVLAFLFETWT